MWKRGLSIKRFNATRPKKKNDVIVIEKQLLLYINNQLSHTFNIVPSNEQALVMGYLLSIGKIKAVSDLLSIEIKDNSVYVDIKLGATDNSDTHVIQKLVLDPMNVHHLVAYFQEKSILFKDTAVTHSAAICDDKQVLFFAEDLNRLNAVEKAMGLAAMADVTFTDKVLMTTGKVDRVMIEKTFQLQIPVIISRTGPTDKAFDFAKNKGIQIIGFARNTRYSLY